MSVTYLNENATGFAAANWEDATGFANGAELYISDGTVAATDNADQSASDVLSFVVLEGRSGNLGTAAAPVKFEADTPAGARVEYRANAGHFYGATSGSGWARLVLNASGGSFTGVSGTITALECTRVAGLTIETGMVVTTAYLYSGSGVIENNATGLTNCYIFGGRWTIKRDGVYHIYGGHVTFDVPDATPTTTVNQYNPDSTVVVARGDIATVSHLAGMMRTKGERAVSIGGSAYTRGPAQFARTAFNDVDTIAAATVIGGQTAQIGGPVPL